MAITRYAGDRFTVNTADTKPTGVLDGAYLIDTGNLTQYVRRTAGGSQVWSQLAGGGGGGTPGGANTQVQFNNAGAFGGDADLTFTDGNRLNVNKLGISGIIYDSNNSIGNGGMVLANEGTTGVHWKNIESVLSGVGGSGVANYVARWSDEDTLTSGTIYDDGDVGIGTANPGARLHVFDSTVSDVVILETNNPNSSNGPDVIFYRNSASPADGDELGRLAFRGRNDGSQDINYANIIAEAIEVSDNIEGGALNFNTYDNGTSATRMVITGDNVGIGTTAPFRKFHVYATGDQSNENNGAFWIGDSTTNKMGLYGGVNNTNNYSYIGSVRTSQAYEDLILNPNGGKVGIVCTSPAYQLSVGNDNNGLHTDNGTDFSIGQYGSSANILALHSAGDMWLNIDSNGNDTTKKLYIAEGGLKTAASAIATFQQDGNVGIGTTAPAKLLHVEGSNPQIRLKASDATDAIINIDAGASKDAYLTFSQNGSAKWAVVHDYAGTDKLSIYNYANNANTVTFLPDGNVGIGITTPAQLLSVEGSESGAWITKLKNTHATNGNGLLVQAADNNDVKVVEFRNLAETSTFTMMGDGKVGVGSDDPRCILNVSKAYTTGYGVEDCYLMLGGQEASANSTRLIGFGYIHGTSTHPPANIGFLQNSNDDFTNGDLIFRTRETTANVSPTERMRILSDGNVGIGDNLIAPAHRLHVSGDAIISGVLYDSTNSSGVAGHVFTSEAGGPQWKMIEDVLSGVGGNGTANYVPKWEDSDTIGDSVIYDDGTSVGINTNNPGSFSAGANNLVIGSGVGDEGVTIYSATGSQGMIRFADGTSSTGPYRGRVEYDHSVDTLYLGAGGSTQFHFRSNGSLRLAETSLLEWGGDTNGIYGSNTSNYFAIRTNNAEQVRIDANGNVGIGTDNPGGRLETYVTAGGQFGLRLNSNFAGGNAVDFKPYISSVSNAGFSIDLATSTKFVINSDGNVGIGTTSPSTLLHIDDDTTAAGLTIKGAGPGYVNAAIVLKATNSTSYRGLGVFMHDAGGDTEWYAGTPYAAADQYMIARKASQASSDYGTAVTGNALFTVKNDGKVGIGTTTPDAELQVMNNDSSSYRFGYGGTSDVYFDADDVYFRSDNGGANQITKKGGSLGIGVVNAEHKLHVAGDAIISGYLYDSTNSTGVDGYVLTSREDGPQWDYIEDILSGVGGNGTANYVPKWEDSDTIKNSIIYDDGTNVGISTVTPSGKFHVYGGAGRFDVTNAATKDHHLTVSEGNATDWRPYAGSTTAALQLQSLEDLTGDARGILLAVKSEGNPELTTSEGLDINVNATVGTNNGTLAIKVQSDGNVGIGTNAAAALLQVETDQIIKGGIVRDGSWHRGLEITTENANYASLFFGNQQTTKYSGIVWTSSTSGNTGNKRGAQIYAHPTSATNTNLAFDTNNIVGSSSPTTKMTILGDGNVGIGITAPGYKTKIVSPSLTWGTTINDDTAALSVVKGYQDGANDSDVNVARFASVRASYGAAADWAGHISLFTNSSVTNGSEGTERARITWDGNNRLYFGRSTDKVLTVQTAGGNVGIGDNLVAPEHKLHVSGDAIISGVLYDSNNSSGVAGHVFTSEAGGPQWKMIEDVLSGVGGNGTAEYIPRWTDSDTIGDSVIAQSGSAIGIGTTAPTQFLDILATQESDAGIRVTLNCNLDSQAPQLVLNRAAQNGGIVDDGDVLGVIKFGGYDGNSVENSAKIEATVNGTPSNDNMPTDLSFYTASAGSPVHAMTIDKDQQIGIGTAVVGTSQKLDVVFVDDVNGAGVTFRNNDGSLQFRNVAGSANQFNPQIKGNSKHVNNVGLRLLGNAASGEDSGTTPLILLRGTVNNAKATTRPVLDIEDGDGTKLVSVAADGNVGIGTTSTSELLHAYKTADAAVAIAVENPNAGTDARARIQLMSNGGTATLTTYSAAFTTSNQNIADSALLRASSLSGGLGLSADGATPLRFWTNDTERIRVDSGGNVGVGTTTPKTLLEASGVIRSTHATSVTAGAGIEMLYNNTDGTGYLYSYDRDGSAYKTTRIGSESYFIADGNVGIATATPEHQFQVYGDALISGKFYDSTNSTGDKGYVLTSDDTGPFWAASGDFDGLSGNLITTGQTLQTQITSNDTDIAANTANLITTGQTLQTQITANDGDISTLTSNLITTGQTLQTQITANDGDISTLTSNLITTGQTLQTQITSNDTDIATNATNIATNATNIATNVTNIATNVTNIATNVTNIATNASNLVLTGNFLESEINTVSGLIPSTVVDGAGVTGYTARWFDGNTLTTGTLYDDGTNVGIGTATPSTNLDVNGTTRVGGVFSSEANYTSITEGLVAHYPLNEGTGDVSDRSKSAVGAKSLTNCSHTTIKGYACIDFPDSSNGEYINLGNPNALQFTSAGFTTSAWVHLDAGRDYGGIINKTNINGVYTYMCCVMADGRMSTYNNSAWYHSTAGDVPLGKWTLLTYSWDGTNLRQYANGVLKSTSAISFTNNTAHVVTIGSWYEVNSSYDINGQIRDARIWNQGLSSQEVMALYKSTHNFNDHLYVDANTGYVGIGTTVPTAKLESWGAAAGSAFKALTLTNDARPSSTLTGTGVKIEFNTADAQEGPSTTAFIQAKHTAETFNASAVLQFSAGNSANIHQTIQSDGNVGIGTTSASRLLDVNGTAYFRDDIYFGNTVLNPASGFATQTGMGWDKSTGEVQISSTTSPLQLGRHGSTGPILVCRYESVVKATLDTSGDLSIAGTLSESSSIAIKENVETYSPSLENISKMRPVRFNKKKSTKKEVGLVAEELAEMFPELVETDEKGNPSGVNYSRAVAVLLHGFKELYKEVKELKEKI